MNVFKYIVLLFCSVCLLGCPNEFQKLEQAYFDDQFFLTLQLSEDMLNKKKYHKQLETFLNRNGDYLLAKIIKETTAQIEKGPSIKLYFLFHNTLKYLNRCHEVFPAQVPKKVLNNYERLIEEYASETVQDQRLKIEKAYQAHLYRHVIRYLDNLEQVNQLTQNDINLRQSCHKKLKRVLRINAIKALDTSIEQAIENMTSPKSNNETITNPYALTRFGVNVPKLMKDYMVKDMRKTLSSHISLQTGKTTQTEPAQYELYVKVDVSDFESTYPELITEKGLFSYKKDNDDQWQVDEFEYDVFVETKTVTVTIDAEILLVDNREKVAQFVYETEALSEIKTVGDFNNVPLDIVLFEYPIEYKAYQVQQQFQSNKELLIEAIKDAIDVLSIKVADTIDIDLDPWFLFSLK